MREMLGKAGRAWYFLSRMVSEPHFEIPNVQDIPAFLRKAQVHMEAIGHDYDIITMDIEGCFPNMPKEAIKLSAMELVSKLGTEGQKGVWVPKSRQQKPSWCSDKPSWCHDSSGTWMPFAELLDILVFALDNAFVKMEDGTILKQLNGIPIKSAFSSHDNLNLCLDGERMDE